MCGRFGRFNSPAFFARQLNLWRAGEPTSPARYNTPPGESVWTVADDPRQRSRLAMQTPYWGFVPSWAENMSRAQINARSETAATKPFFRKAFHLRRCVIAADYWIEWQRTYSGKQPHVLRPAGAEPFFFAGIWSWPRSLPERYAAAGSRTVAILTDGGRGSIAGIHARMPIALTARGARDWLAAGTDTAQLQQRLVHGRHEAFEAWPVTTRVNKSAEDDAGLLEPV